jgi:hypothetical protein
MKTPTTSPFQEVFNQYFVFMNSEYYLIRKTSFILKISNCD